MEEGTIRGEADTKLEKYRPEAYCIFWETSYGDEYFVNLRNCFWPKQYYTINIGENFEHAFHENYYLEYPDFNM